MDNRNAEDFEYQGAPLRIIGNRPGRLSVFLAGGKDMGKKGIVSFYRSALEASAEAMDVFYVPGLPFAEAIEKGIYEKYEGSLFAFLPMGLESVSKALLSRCIITGGGVISPVEDRAFFSFEALRAAMSVAAMMAHGTIVGKEDMKGIPQFVYSALDNGRDVAVLETTLCGKGARNLVREGAECVDTLSSFLSSPSYICYPDIKGKYGIMGERFSLLDKKKYEKR
ncbi:MAG: hypothetical protein ACI4S4_06715 [Candidatus Ornithospirochaeta sp.]